MQISSAIIDKSFFHNIFANNTHNGTNKVYTQVFMVTDHTETSFGLIIYILFYFYIISIIFCDKEVAFSHNYRLNILIFKAQHLIPYDKLSIYSHICFLFSKHFIIINTIYILINIK